MGGGEGTLIRGESAYCKFWPIALALIWRGRLFEEGGGANSRIYGKSRCYYFNLPGDIFLFVPFTIRINLRGKWVIPTNVRFKGAMSLKHLEKFGLRFCPWPKYRGWTVTSLIIILTSIYWLFKGSWYHLEFDNIADVQAANREQNQTYDFLRKLITYFLNNFSKP